MAELLVEIPRPVQAGYPRIDYERLIDDHLGLPDRVRSTWSKLARGVAEAGGIEQLHAARDEYRDIMRDWIRQLEEFVEFCHRVSASLGQTPPIVAQAEQGLVSLKHFESNLFERWQTLEDLEDLILAEVHPLTAAELSTLAKKYPPPPAWYDETADPFTAEE
jgi:hypothetical protein